MLIINKIEVCPKLLSFLKLFSVLVLSDFSIISSKKNITKHYFAIIILFCYIILLLLFDWFSSNEPLTNFFNDNAHVRHLLKSYFHLQVSDWRICVHHRNCTLFAWNYEHLVASCSYQENIFTCRPKNRKLIL